MIKRDLRDKIKSEVYGNLGALFRKRGNISEAANFYEKSIEKNLANTESHYYLGVCYVILDRFTESEKEYKKALQLNPDNKLVWMDLGTLFLLYSKDYGLKQDRGEEGTFYYEIGNNLSDNGDIEEVKRYADFYSKAHVYVEFDEDNNLSFANPD